MRYGESQAPLNLVTIWTPQELLAHRTLDEVWSEGMSVHEAAARWEGEVREQGQGIHGDVVQALRSMAEEDAKFGRSRRADLWVVRWKKRR